MTNKKLRTRFRVVPKSTTLDDLERSLCTLFQNTCVFGAKHENLNEDRPTLSAVLCSSMTLLSGNIRFMRICAGVLWRGDIKRHWVVENGDVFSAFGVNIFGSFRNKANVIIHYYFVPHWLSTDRKTNDFE